MRLTMILPARRYNARMEEPGARKTQPALEAEDLTCFYASSGRGISGVSLTVARGEVFGLMGPNGSGKSTLLRVLSTAIAPDSGSFRVCGADGSKEKRKVRARMGLMVDRPTHYGDLTGRANASFFASLYGMERAKAEGVVAELFDFFDLAEYADDRVKTYSYGMGKKLALVEALAHGPEVLLLDEPCAALDPAGRDEVIRIMERLGGDTTVIYSTHILQDVERVADQVAIVAEGRRVLQAPMRELLADGEVVVLEVEGNPAPLAAELLRQPYVARAEHAALPRPGLSRIGPEVADVDAARQAIPALVVGHDVVLVGLRAEQRTLEEVFLALTAGAGEGDEQGAERR